jgi:hypothetical protein
MSLALKDDITLSRAFSACRGEFIRLKKGIRQPETAYFSA